MANSARIPGSSSHGLTRTPTTRARSPRGLETRFGPVSILPTNRQMTGHADPIPSNQDTAIMASEFSHHARRSCAFYLSSVWPLSSRQLASHSTKDARSSKSSYEAEINMLENPACRNSPFKALPTYGFPPFAICISLNA